MAQNADKSSCASLARTKAFKQKNLTNFAKINAQKRKFDKMQILKFFKAGLRR